jgi:GNAT superfamily N-acetyltransferase
MIVVISAIWETEQSMIVRLHNLAARRPTLADRQAVAALIIACDTFDLGSSDIVEAKEEELQKAWQEPHFQLSSDAWVIVNRNEQIVGYSAVWYVEMGQLNADLYVHPEYRGRGIGTLLMRMIEARARLMMDRFASDVRVSLRQQVCRTRKAAGQLLRREGYSVVRQFWKVQIEMPEVPASALDAFSGQEKLRLNLIIDVDNPVPTQLPQCEGMSHAQLYEVYEKVLREVIVSVEPALLACR